MNYSLKDNEIPRQLSWQVETNIGLTNKIKNNQLVLLALFGVNCINDSQNVVEKYLEMQAIMGHSRPWTIGSILANHWARCKDISIYRHERPSTIYSTRV